MYMSVDVNAYSDVSGVRQTNLNWYQMAMAMARLRLAAVHTRLQIRSMGSVMFCKSLFTSDAKFAAWEV